MTYLDLASSLVKRLEGCKLVGYPDTGGVPTIGYGHTGSEVRIGQTITQDQADQYLMRDLIRADVRLEGACNPHALDGLLAHERAALVSFVFNVGAGPGWQIWKDLNDGRLAEVPNQLRRFDKGKVHGQLVAIPGLAHRREAEIAFWNTADVEVAAALARPQGAGSGVDLAPPSHETVSMVTPPTPDAPPPLAKTSLVAKAVTLTGGITAAVANNGDQVHKIVSPFADHAKLYQSLDTLAIGAIIVAGILGVLIHEYQASERKT